MWCNRFTILSFDIYESAIHFCSEPYFLVPWTVILSWRKKTPTFPSVAYVRSVTRVDLLGTLNHISLVSTLLLSFFGLCFSRENLINNWLGREQYSEQRSP